MRNSPLWRWIGSKKCGWMVGKEKGRRRKDEEEGKGREEDGGTGWDGMRWERKSKRDWMAWIGVIRPARG